MEGSVIKSMILDFYSGSKDKGNYVPPKWQLSFNGLYGVISQWTVLFMKMAGTS
jgi:hypothetical protein